MKKLVSVTLFLFIFVSLAGCNRVNEKELYSVFHNTINSADSLSVESEFGAGKDDVYSFMQKKSVKMARDSDVKLIGEISTTQTNHITEIYYTDGSLYQNTNGAKFAMHANFNDISTDYLGPLFDINEESLVTKTSGNKSKEMEDTAVLTFDIDTAKIEPLLNRYTREIFRSFNLDSNIEYSYKDAAVFVYCTLKGHPKSQLFKFTLVNPDGEDIDCYFKTVFNDFDNSPVTITEDFTDYYYIGA